TGVRYFAVKSRSRGDTPPRGSERPSGRSLLDAVAESDDRLDHADGRLAIVLLLGLGEPTVRNQIGMVLLGVVAFRAVRPPLGDALACPNVVVGLGEPLDEVVHAI